MRRRVAVAYYSSTGYTKALALAVVRRLKAEGVEVDCCEIEPVEEPSLLNMGHMTLTRSSEPICEHGLELSEANLLAIGTPIWMGSPAPYIRRFVEEVTDLKGIPVVLFATCRKRDGRAADELRELVRKQGGRPLEYHVWKQKMDGTDGIGHVAEAVVATTLSLLPSE